ncbi:metallophosphoesterase [Olivibacter sp. SDN3]|uniref:metallophosphoesterase n=1 Tax=Olivibacter sp. SDN3 TaxID=2764720 RepID=UPI001651AF7D|nr:metallophosphoesterase [Olivibacter sp. SDN3]QNL50816.1 metallophosphoesterase [Olivibacter sp. SDN3]
MRLILLNVFILLLIDFYIYYALQKSSIKWVKSKLFKSLWWTYNIALFFGVIASILLNIPLMLRSVILVAFFLTFTSKAVYVLVLLIDEIRRGSVWVRRRVISVIKKPGKEVRQQELDANTISRSQFITRAGIVVASVPFATLSWGIAVGGYDYQVRRQKLYLPNLPKAFHGIKIGQLSDIHSGSFYNKKAVLGGIDMLLAEKPEVVFFTGDLVNNKAEEMRNYQDLFSKVSAPLGVFSTLGNHDYGDYFYGKEDSPKKRKNLQQIKEIHGLMGWELLLNEHRKLQVDNEQIGVLGVENWGTGRFPKYGRIDLAKEGTEDLPVKLLLSHDPSHWRAQILENNRDIDVMFAGHTHGMQFGVRGEHYQWSPAEYVYKEWAGLYQENQQKLYVNVGYGFLGYPGRVGILPEITIFELIAGNDPVEHT